MVRKRNGRWQRLSQGQGTPTPSPHEAIAPRLITCVFRGFPLPAYNGPFVVDKLPYRRYVSNMRLAVKWPIFVFVVVCLIFVIIIIISETQHSVSMKRKSYGVKVRGKRDRKRPWLTFEYLVSIILKAK